VTRRILSILALVSLAAILANIVYTRGFGTRLGGPPAKIEGAYLTEESWIVGEIARDVVEMSAYPAARAAASVAATEIAGTYRVSTGIAGDNPVALDLRQDLWAPAEFTKIARAALAPEQGRERDCRRCDARCTSCAARSHACRARRCRDVDLARPGGQHGRCSRP
jgi:hypothetical protein